MSANPHKLHLTDYATTLDERLKAAAEGLGAVDASDETISAVNFADAAPQEVVARLLGDFDLCFDCFFAVAEVGAHQIMVDSVRRRETARPVDVLREHMIRTLAVGMLAGRAHERGERRS